MLEFSLKLTYHFWAETELRNDKDAILLEASYLSDVIKNLVIAVTSSLNGQMESVCKWQDEPGESRWIFITKENAVSLKIVVFDNEFSRLNDNQGKIIFSASTDLLKLARMMSREMEKLLNLHEEKGYLEIWNYQYPTQEVESLRKAIKEYRANAKP